MVALKSGIVETHLVSTILMPKDFYLELARMLTEAGWRRVPGGKGSHEKWRHLDSGKTVSVPRSKSRHTANEVLKQAGLPKAF